jgi:hypothetical protein
MTASWWRSCRNCPAVEDFGLTPLGIRGEIGLACGLTKNERVYARAECAEGLRGQCPQGSVGGPAESQIIVKGGLKR